MKALCILLLCAGCAAVEMDGNTIKLNPTEEKRCAAEGGCVVMTVDVLRKLLDKLKTCGRDWT